MEPKVSVIIPTCNDRPEKLARALKSVEDQTFKDYEIIIEEDKERRGVARARNLGFAKAKGKYIVFLDDDNELLPTFLEETVYMLDTSMPEVGGIRVGRIIKQPDYDDYAPPTTHTGFDSIDWGFLMRREVMEKIKCDETLYGDEDADFGIQFAKHWYQIPIDKPLSIAYADDDDSMCFPSEKRLKGLTNFINKNINEFKKSPDELRYAYRLVGRNFYRAGYKLIGLKYFWLSFWAKSNWRTFKHLFFILFGWDVYNSFMDREERRAAATRV